MKGHGKGGESKQETKACEHCHGHRVYCAELLLYTKHLCDSARFGRNHSPRRPCPKHSS